MADQRPDPDALLASVQAQEARAERGKLKIFFGFAPGVGKTYAMLEAGRKVAKEGVDVLVGYVEPHARPDTQALVLGLDMLSRREVVYRDRTLLEFDLEAALARCPQLVLVDELAHTNAPGMTHAKRWQDIEDLLKAGIDVFTTVNVQHLETVNDLVAQITGIPVRETVPDSVFEQANEVELVDLAPDDLIERLREGKVYFPEQARHAIDNFFRKGNLIALRELSLRRMAERVDAQMADYRAENLVTRIWPASERLLVCVSASPHSMRLVRATRRMATSLRAPWIAVHVETAGDTRMSAADRDRLAQTLQLAEQLGAETVTLPAAHFADEVLHLARTKNVSKIVVGKPQQPRWQEWLRGSFVYELTRKCGDVDIYVITGEQSEPVGRRPAIAEPAINYAGYGSAAGIVAVCSVVCWLAFPVSGTANLIMIYLLGVVASALWLGRGPSALAAVLSVATFDYFFVPPYLTFAVSDTQYLLTFAVMLMTGLIVGTLTARVRFQAESARAREHRTAALYAMSRELVDAATLLQLLPPARRHIGQAFAGDVHLLFPDPATRRLRPLGEHADQRALDEHELGVAQWAFDHQQPAGRGTDTLPSARGLYLPLNVSQKSMGVMALVSSAEQRYFSPDQLRQLVTFAGQIALAAERIEAAAEARKLQVQMEAERLRNSLLSAVSHDLRTPLAAITGASSTLLENDALLEPGVRRELAESIFIEGDRLNRLVANLLDMTRLEAGAIALQKEWQPLEEVIGVALNRLARPLHGREVRVQLPADLPLVPIDGLLVQQVLTNLLENAAKYSPPGTPIEITARLQDNEVEVAVADRGPGINAADRTQIFEKFYRSANAAGRMGVGLGLAICRSIVELHGGRIAVDDRPGGGAVFRFRLPLAGSPPPAVPEEVPVEHSRTE
ncbi:MAG: sensor histidine kinase KdpD [Pirellulales bacterium]|nr:sensor histidine kinase KdpD [Pirellulales bacterium]